jgi:hypothetical protein
MLGKSLCFFALARREARDGESLGVDTGCGAVVFSALADTRPADPAVALPRVPGGLAAPAEVFLKRFAKYPAGGGGHSKLIYEHSRRRVLRKALLRRFPVDTL